MPPKAKGKATAGAAAALASALGVEKFTRIKHGDLQHEADVKRSFSVPGSYWGDECTEDEKNQLFAAEIVEVTLTHKFQGTSMKQPALRFVLTGAASSTVDDSPLWISVDEYSMLTEKTRQQEKDETKAAAEAAKAAASGVKDVVEGGGDDAVEEITGAELQASRMKAAIFAHWSAPVLLSSEDRPHPKKVVDDGNGKMKPLMVPHHQWQFTCQELKSKEKGGDGEELCLHTRIDWDGSNGNLFKHFQDQHKELYTRLSAGSKHTRMQTINGVPGVTMMTWNENFPHHIMYAVETYRDYAPLSRARKDGNRGVLSSLQPGYVPPCQLTQHQMMIVMDELMDEEICKDIKRWRKEIGPGWLGEATDGLTSNGHHYVTFNGSVIEDEPLRVERFVLDYHEYSGSGNADALAEDWKRMEERYGIIESDRGRPTADGAAPQQKAIRIVTGKDGRKCANHQEARAALEAFKSKNPEADKVIRKYRGLSRFARKSTMYKKDIKKHEKEVMFTADPTEMLLPNATRWTGNITTLERTNEKEPAVRKLHAPLEDDGARTIGASSVVADSSSGSDSSDDSGSEETEQSATSKKHQQKYRARVESKSLLSTDWASGKDLESCWRNSLEFIVFMQTQKSTTLEHRLSLARALIVVNTSPKALRLVMTRTQSDTGEVSYARDAEDIDASDLMDCAQTFRSVYAASLTERFFSNDLILDEDLIALMLNWITNYKSTLGYDRRLIARAERVFSEALLEVEEELEDAQIETRPSKKAKPLDGSSSKLAPSVKTVGLMSMARSGDGDYSTAAGDAVDDDDEDDDPDETTVDKFNKLRALKGKERSNEIVKYLDQEGGFSLLKFLDKQRVTLKAAFVLGRRVLSDPAGQAVSESTFSIHAAFDGDLRKDLAPEAISRMIKLNRNHQRYFNRIKPLIKARYEAKFGGDVGSAKAAAATGAPAAGN